MSIVPDKSSLSRRQRSLSHPLLPRTLRTFWRQTPWKRRLGTGFFVAIVVLLTMAVLIVDSANRLGRSWQSLHRVFITLSDQPATDLTLDDFTLIQAGVDDLITQIERTRVVITPVAPFVRLHPRGRAALDSLAVAQELLNAADKHLEGLQPIMYFVLFNSISDVPDISSGERVIELLEFSEDRFLAAAEHLNHIDSLLAQIDYAQLQSDLLITVEQMRNYKNQLSDLNQVMLDAPQLLSTMLGINQERSYLVLGQNNDEIRPSGGFISTYGWLGVRNGRITDFDYGASTPTRPNPPSASFADTLDIPDWWINYAQPAHAAWDGSWYVDFPTTAQIAADYYAAGRNPRAPVNGVIAIDITGFEMLLGAMGGVRVADSDITVSADNFRQLVYDVRAVGEDQELHKAFVAQIYSAILEAWRVQHQTPELLGILLKALEQKQIMIYFSDPDAQNAARLLGWTGSQQPADGHDYILAADANLSGNKSNNSIERSLTYDVELLPDASVNSRLSVQYNYFAATAAADPAVDERFHGPLVYLNALQVFVPPHSTLQTSANLSRVQAMSLDMHTLFTGRMRVDFDTSERVQFIYQTSGIVETLGAYQHYQLLLQKQPGTHSQSFDVRISLPENAQVLYTVPEASVIYEFEKPVLDYRLTLDTDQWIEIVYAHS